jgi:hypothetical protein
MSTWRHHKKKILETEQELLRPVDLEDACNSYTVRDFNGQGGMKMKSRNGMRSIAIKEVQNMQKRLNTQSARGGYRGDESLNPSYFFEDPRNLAFSNLTRMIVANVKNRKVVQTNYAATALIALTAVNFNVFQKFMWFQSMYTILDVFLQMAPVTRELKDMAIGKGLKDIHHAHITR